MSNQDHLLHLQHLPHLSSTIHQASTRRRYIHRLNQDEITMCLEVKYRCICGVMARTQRIACIASIAHPHEEAHQLQLHDMVLPREEWATRQGLCPQDRVPSERGNVNRRGGYPGQMPLLFDSDPRGFGCQ